MKLFTRFGEATPRPKEKQYEKQVKRKKGNAKKDAKETLSNEKVDG